MPITVVCQGIVRFDKETNQYIRCGTEIPAPESAAGKTVRCPTCGDEVAVPKSAPLPTVGAAPAAAPPAPRSVGAAAFSAPPAWSSPAETADDAPVWFPDANDETPAANVAANRVAEQRLPNPFAAPPAPPPDPQDADDFYKMSPAEETPRPTHPLAAGGVYQLGEEDEAPERAVHAGWCDRCGHDIPATLTVCPKCGYQHGMAHVVLRKDPVLPPSMQVCPSCERQLPPGTLLCEACGYHSGLKQKFPALAKQQGPTTQPPPTGLDQWVSRQIEGGPSPKNAMLWLIGGVGAFLALGLILTAGILMIILGPWGLCLIVPVLAVVVVTGAVYFAQKRTIAKAEVAAKRKGIEAAIWNLMLFLMRAIGWRSPAPPFPRYRALDVRNTGFGDNDLGGMQNRNDYEALDFEGTQVSDASLPYMAAMPQVKFVCVRRSQITEQGAWNLQRAKPDLWLWY